MAQKSRDLDKRLAQILVPLGFKRIPKTRNFIRLCGDGVFQGFYWYHEPRYHFQELNCWIESVWREPDKLFRPYLMYKGPAVMISPIGCAEYEYREDEYIPVRVHANPSEEVQIKMFLERILPRFERWKRPEDVYLAHRGEEMATIAGHPLHQPRYWYGRDYTLALLLDKQGEANKYLEAQFESQEDRIRWFLDSGKTPGKYDVRQLEALQWKKDTLTARVAIQEYLLKCREQNLKDFDDLMAGKRGEKEYGTD